MLTIEAELCKTLNISWADARDLSSYARGKLGIIPGDKVAEQTRRQSILTAAIEADKQFPKKRNLSKRGEPEVRKEGQIIKDLSNPDPLPWKLQTSPIEEDAKMLETLIGPTGGLQLQFSYGKWPGSGIKADNIDVLCCDGRHTNLHIRRHPRMARRAMDIVYGDAIVASVDMVPAEEGPKTKYISMHNLRRDDNQKLSGSICSSVGRSVTGFGYKAEVSFPQSDFPSYKCISCPGPLGPQIEMRSGDDENPCAIIRDVSKPFDKRTSIQISVPLVDAVNLHIILCITADIVNEMHVREQKGTQDQIMSAGLDCFCTVICEAICTVS
mmetsp:Transcript_24016/g.47704  ORF Transcript_24016/g.47704 Transcript_24016/m.47704 type:complete len:327 (+) Transcript_24016:395-1375(+)